MPDYLLILGNKNYSSWSCRAGLVMMRTGVPFDEIVFDLGAPGARDKIAAYSPTSRVPALWHDGRAIWDSLAIAEFLAERHPEAGLWPADAASRAHARSVTAEMHSGFPRLRRSMPFNVRRSSPGKGRDPGVVEEIERIVSLWAGCRRQSGGAGPFLFGEWTIADAFFTPVASRFRTYTVELDGEAQAYADAVLAWPAMEAWSEAARAETSVEPEYDL